MTTYAASVAVGSGSQSTNLVVAVIPGQFEIRVPRAVLKCTFAVAGTSAGTQATISVYSTGATGGTVVPVTALRGGSPACTATAKKGATGSGTQGLIEQFVETDIGPYQPATGQTFVEVNPSFTFEPPFDVIVSPGSALVASIANGAGSNSNAATISIYFEELRLSWHY